MVAIHGEASMSVKDFLSAKLGYEQSFLGYAAAALVGFFLLFFVVFAYAIKSQLSEYR